MAFPDTLSDRARALDGAPLDALKLLAAALMLLDHVNTVLLDGGAVWMWRLGRAAFPLFALVLACHLARAGSGDDGGGGTAPAAGRAATTLLLFGIPAQPAFAAAFPFGTTEANILFTLAAGAALAAWCAGPEAPPWRARAALPAGLLLALLAPNLARTGVDFGMVGMLLPSALLLLLGPRRAEGAAWTLLLLLALNARTWTPPGEPASFKVAADALCALLLMLAAPWAALRLRGRRRFLPRFALHLFYPTHLAALAALRALLG